MDTPVVGCIAESAHLCDTRRKTTLECGDTLLSKAAPGLGSRQRAPRVALGAHQPLQLRGASVARSLRGIHLSRRVVA